MLRLFPRAPFALILLLIAPALACGGSPAPVPQSVVPPLGPPPPPPGQAKGAPAGPTSDANLIPREILFGNPDKAIPRISPDGKWIAYLAPVDGVLNVVVAPLSDPSKATPATHSSHLIYQFAWTHEPNVILYLQDKDGDENSHVYAVFLPGGAPRDLTPFANTRAELNPTPSGGTSAKHPDEVVIAMNDRDPEFQDLYRVNLKTGARTLVQRNDGYRGFVVGDDFAVHLAVKANRDGGKTYLTPGPKKAFETPYMTVAFEDMESVFMEGLDDNGKTFYLEDGRGRDTMALVAMDAATKKVTLLAEDPRSDVSLSLSDPRTHTPLLALTSYDRKRHIVLDKRLQPDLHYLKTVVPGADFTLDSCSDDLKTCIVTFNVSDGPERYYAYDRAKHEAAFLFSDMPKLEGLALSKMLPVTITSPVQETFLAQCLGGKYQPIGDDFEGSTIAAPAGAQLVYGLESALKQRR